MIADPGGAVVIVVFQPLADTYAVAVVGLDLDSAGKVWRHH
jgi:hypothetical protein